MPSHWTAGHFAPAHWADPHWVGGAAVEPPDETEEIGPGGGVLVRTPSFPIPRLRVRYLLGVAAVDVVAPAATLRIGPAPAAAVVLRAPASASIRITASLAAVLISETRAPVALQAGGPAAVRVRGGAAITTIGPDPEALLLGALLLS